MKTLRIAATCAVVLIVGHASAQEDKTVPQDITPPAAQDVGGTPQMSGTASGSPMRITHQQVYDEMVRAEKSGEMARLQGDLYHGN
ncbi:hypothetical protein [Paraburkholderia sp. JPY419]|uniref:hypothetical protein n=1 Tax=Paraburkholderia sp. JPY419 TaxID=667660 RepID=UPI003D19B8F0